MRMSLYRTETSADLLKTLKMLSSQMASDKQEGVARKSPFFKSHPVLVCHKPAPPPRDGTTADVKTAPRTWQPTSILKTSGPSHDFLTSSKPPKQVMLLLVPKVIGKGVLPPITEKKTRDLLVHGKDLAPKSRKGSPMNTFLVPEKRSSKCTACRVLGPAKATAKRDVGSVPRTVSKPVLPPISVSVYRPTPKVSSRRPTSGTDAQEQVRKKKLEMNWIPPSLIPDRRGDRLRWMDVRPLFSGKVKGMIPK